MKIINFKKRIGISLLIILSLLSFLIIFLFTFKKDMQSAAVLMWKNDYPYLIVNKKQHEYLRENNHKIIQLSYLKINYEAKASYVNRVEQHYVYSLWSQIPYDDEKNILINYQNIPLIYFLILGGQI